MEERKTKKVRIILYVILCILIVATLAQSIALCVLNNKYNKLANDYEQIQQQLAE